MYKRPPKHVERRKLMILYSVMTLAVVGIVVLLVMVVNNYSYNRATGLFEQQGLVQFASTPSNANVEVDGVRISSRTSTKSSVEPGQRMITFWKDEYKPWSLSTYIEAGSLTWLDYIRLVPEERPIETLYEYEDIADAQLSPTNRDIIAQIDPREPEFRLIDISNTTPKGTVLELPEVTYELAEGEQAAAKQSAPTYSLGDWDESGRYVTVWRTLGDDKQLIVLNTSDVSESVNVSREFSMPIDTAQFAGRSGNVLYVKSGDTVRKLNVSEGTATRSLVGNVATFTLQDSDTITYVSKPHVDTGIRTVGVYRDGDSEPTELRTVVSETDRVSVASRTYYGNTYTAITEGNTFDLYRGHFDQDGEGMKSIASRTLDDEIDSVEFNDSGSHLLVRSGANFASYDIDRNLLATARLTEGSSKDMFWLDSRHLGLIYNGQLSMRNLDGTNIYELNTAHNGLIAGLSRNGTYMYSFGDNDDETVSLQRIRMILP